MTEYTPTTEQIRDRYIQPQSQAEALHPDAHYILSEEFGRWLNKVRTEAKAEAWDEGYTSGHSRAMRRMSDEPNVPPATNPYRKEES